MLVINSRKRKTIHIFHHKRLYPTAKKKSRACVLSQVDNIHTKQIFLMHILMLTGNPTAKGVLMIHLVIERTRICTHYEGKQIHLPSLFLPPEPQLAQLIKI